MKKSKVNPVTPTRGRPAPPKQLSGEALAEWDRICDELEIMGTLCTADRSILALYVRAWARWMKAEEQIDKWGEIVPSPKTKTPSHNPWVTISNNAHGQAVKLLEQLGLTPRSRSIIAKNAAMAATDEAPVDDFADLD